jgi:hypothetical protein
MGVTEMTARAVFGGYDDGSVQGLIEVKDFGRAKLHTNMAAFTPIGVNKNLPAWPFSGFTGRFNHSSFFHNLPCFFKLKTSLSCH